MNLNTLTSSLRRSVRPRAKVLWTSDWVCKSCRTNSNTVHRPRFSTSKTPFTTTKTHMDKPYYITTPIFYVNAGTHLTKTSGRRRIISNALQLPMWATCTPWS